MNGETIRLIVYILLAAACVALFLIFGRRGDGSFSKTASPTPIPSPSAVPKGAPMEKFIRALKQSGMDCTFGDVLSIEDHAFEYPLALPNDRDGAKLMLKTDAIGRVVECTLTLEYMYADEPAPNFSDRVATQIRGEYQKREAADKQLVSEFLDSIYALIADDCKISTIDGKRIADAIESAYSSCKTYDKKAGSARFFCETENAGDVEFLHIFRVIASFDYSK